MTTKKNPSIQKYTLVQHSAYVVGGDPRFEKAVEEWSVGPADLMRIARVGGLIFNTYAAAHDYAYKENYPEGRHGLIPRVEGMFSDIRIDGAPVYIPK